jgi:hypothetical protein
METREPKHFIRFCVERELTDDEFEDMTEIVDEEIGDLVAADEVFEHLGPDNTICYMFQLLRDMDVTDGDIISHEISGAWPAALQWELEASHSDLDLDVADDATPEQIEEAAVNYFRNILKG